MALTLAQSKAKFPRAVNAFTKFWQSPAQPGLSMPVKSVDELITHYRTHRYSDGGVLIHDDFMEEFDGALKYTDANDLGKAMRDLKWRLVRDNSKVGGVVKLPKNEEWFNGLSKQVLKTEGADLFDALTAALKKYILTLALIGLAGVIIYQLLGESSKAAAKAFAKKALRK